MKVDIQSIHFDADKKLLDFIEKKIEKVKTFHEGASHAQVYLKINNDQEKENKHVEVKLSLNGHPIFASQQSGTFEAAIDMVLDKIVIQVKKHKEKIQAKV